jgi:hypothetical protein
VFSTHLLETATTQEEELSSRRYSAQEEEFSSTRRYSAQEEELGSRRTGKENCVG